MKKTVFLLLCCILLAGILPMNASAATDLEKIEVTIDEPAVGNAPQFNCQVLTDGCTVYKFEPVMWFDKTENRYLQRGDYFQEGHAYRIQIWVAAKTGYRFSVDAYDSIHTTGKINHHTATVVKAYEQDPKEVIELSYDYGALVTIHTCTPWFVKRVEPTCSQPGHEGYYHCDCGMNYADTRGQEPVDINSWGIIPTTDHIPSGWRVTQVYHYMVCTACGELLGEEDHMGGTASCLEQAQCTICGSFYGELDKDHRWGPKFDYRDDYGHAWVCADCKGHDAVIPHTPGPEATEKEPQLCKDCGYIITPVKTHVHALTKVAQVPATCTQEGTIEYYSCGGCSERFSDKEGKHKIPKTASLSIGALGHTTCDELFCDADYHWRVCTTCMEVLTETKMVHEMENGVCATCGYQANTNPPAQPKPPLKNPAPEKEATEPTASNQPQEEAPKKPTNTPISPLTAVLIGAVSFSAAITATVIILKRKKN